MSNKLKKIHKKPVETDIGVQGVFFSYFSTIGMYHFDHTELVYKSPAWSADFLVRYGRPEYRRTAWQSVRADLKKVFSDELFAILDKHFGPDGPATDFCSGIPDPDHYNFCEMILKCDRSTPMMIERAKSQLKYRT